MKHMKKKGFIKEVQAKLDYLEKDYVKKKIKLLHKLHGGLFG